MINATLDKMLEDKDVAQYTCGENTLLRQYAESRNDYEQLVIGCICWEAEHDDMIALLRKAGIKTFVMADTSTALFATLRSFLSAGFKVTGAVTLEKIKRSEWDRPLKGIAIEVA